MAPKRKRALSSEDKGGSSTRRKGLLLVCTVVVLLSALLVGWYSRNGVTVKGKGNKHGDHLLATPTNEIL